MDLKNHDDRQKNNELYDKYRNIMHFIGRCSIHGIPTNFAKGSRDPHATFNPTSTALVVVKQWMYAAFNCETFSTSRRATPC